MVSLYLIKTWLNFRSNFLDQINPKYKCYCSQCTSNNISRKGVLIQLEQLELLTLFT